MNVSTICVPIQLYTMSQNVFLFASGIPRNPLSDRRKSKSSDMS